MAIGKLVALDMAILPPPDVMARIIALSAALPAQHTDQERLQLDGEHLPHVTLTQHFMRETDLALAFAHVDEVVANQQPLSIVVTGSSRRRHTVWLSVTRTSGLLELHERLMNALRAVERQGGGAHAFHDGDGRVRDVGWVAGFRRQASGSAFTPHITLGHANEAPAIEPFAFEATTVAACHLGRFCTCRKVLRAWNLGRA